MMAKQDQTISTALVTGSRRSTSVSGNAKLRCCPDHYPAKARRIKIAVSQSESDDTEESCQEEEGGRGRGVSIQLI
jgi:hypothetical protein